MRIRITIDLDDNAIKELKAKYKYLYQKEPSKTQLIKFVRSHYDINASNETSELGWDWKKRQEELDEE